MAPRSDTLGVKYAKNMQHFGCGTALFEPISANDMRPPCVGYLEKDGTWNHIANITWQDSDGSIQGHGIAEGLDVGNGLGLKPLKRAPKKMEQLGIEWRPRTSKGVIEWTVDASGNTPDNIPAGADAHIKYQSRNSFGAVLITQKPITLTSFNDESLFQSWLSANRAALSSSHGPQLRRHGLRLVTRTYVCPSCTIKAWEDKNKEANMSGKAKANMMGELGGELDWTDRLTDKDWSYYTGKEKGDTVVVFFDGIEVPAREWWLEGIKTSIGKTSVSKAERIPSSSSTQSRERRSIPVRPSRYSATDETLDERSLFTGDLWGSDTPLRIHSPLSDRSASRGRQVRCEKADSSRSVSTPSRHLTYDEKATFPGHRSKAAYDPNRRLSMGSTATSDSRANSRAQSLSVSSGETSRRPTRCRSELRRKAGSPSLRAPT